MAGPTDEGKPIKILSSIYLAPRKTVYLLEVGSRVLVVASGNEEVRTLDVINDPVEVEALKKAGERGFPAVFGRFMSRREATDHAVEAQKIVSEGRAAVGQFLNKVKDVSKNLKKRSDDEEGT
jgi:flagellar biogenesis protein FliO